MDTAEIERELSDLETRIDRLRALYEQYFLGIEKMEPSIPRRDAERKIQILRKEQIRNTAQRFKFQMLVQRYNTMQQHWARVTREIENGTYRRDVMRAAARFGEKEALTITGKKRQKQYAVLAEAQTLARSKRRPGEDDAPEFADSDLLVDDDSPPSRVAPPAPIAPIAPKETESTERKEPLGGLRWAAKGPVDPAGAVRPTEAQTGVKRRLAELAASMKGPAPQPSDETSTPQPRLRPPPVLSTGARTQAARADSLDLDLDLDESAASQRSAAMRKPGAPSAPLGGSAIPGATAVRAPNPALKPGATALHPSTPSDTSGPRAPAPRVAADGTLPDQRMRQIYTKYVEAKRSANESTAGVTYEKLAETLRAQADRLKVSHPAKSIDYDVVIKDGKTLLKPVLR